MIGMKGPGNQVERQADAGLIVIRVQSLHTQLAAVQLNDKRASPHPQSPKTKSNYLRTI